MVFDVLFGNKKSEGSPKPKVEASLQALSLKSKIERLGLKVFQETEEEFFKKYSILTDLDEKQQRLIYSNDLFLIEEKDTKKRILLVHHFNKMDLQEIVPKIEFDEIQYLSEATMTLFIKKQNEIGKEINEEEGAEGFLLALLEKARLNSVSDIYISLLGINLIFEFRSSMGIKEVARNGVQEARIMRNTLARLCGQESKDPLYDKKIKINNIYYRVSYQKTHEGWASVIRSYNTHIFKDMKSLDSLGHSQEVRDAIRRLFAKRDGFVFFTGATGNGKTTTQYACLSEQHKKHRKIYSIENPVEQVQEYNQMDTSIYESASEEYKITSEDILKTLLRMRPDIICIAEVRDRDEMLLAYRASITGHLVVLTFHTNNAMTAFNRLTLESGLSLEDVKTATNGILFQRLTRHLCPTCRIKADVHGHYKANPKGCNECSKGYLLRELPICEVMEFPTNKDFDLKNKDTYKHILLEDDAKRAYDLGLIDELHYLAVINGEENPWEL